MDDYGDLFQLIFGLWLMASGVACIAAGVALYFIENRETTDA